jgi:hypothetical protein
MTRWGIAAVVLGAGVLLAGCGGGVPAGHPATATVVTTGASITQAPSAGPTAQRVVDAFKAAGLRVPNPRDNSGHCESLGCTQMITTDAVTVLSYADPAKAKDYAVKAGTEAHQAGSVVLSYLAARTPAADRPKYEAELSKLGG